MCRRWPLGTGPAIPVAPGHRYSAFSRPIVVGTVDTGGGFYAQLSDTAGGAGVEIVVREMEVVFVEIRGRVSGESFRGGAQIICSLEHAIVLATRAHPK